MDDRVFSVDDIADQFWPLHAPPTRLHDDDGVEQPSSSAAAASSSSKMMRMNRSLSEWEFQMFLQEAVSPDHNTITRQSDGVVEIKGNHHHYSDNQQWEVAAAARGPPQNILIDADEYQAFLKSRLELECAAVALTRANNGKAQESAAASSDIGSLSSNSSLNKASGQDSSKIQKKDCGVPVGVPPHPAVSRKSGAQVKSTTSGSSGEQSDDDEAEGETEATQSTDPADAKRMRRMVSNRESARRSRRRKQAHLTELETQVSQLRVENSSLVKRLSGISQKYNEAAVDNRVLKADVETLRAKVKMAEETVKRVTGLNPLFQAMSEISTIMTMPSFASSPSDTSADAAVPVQDDPKQHYYHAPSNNHLPNHRIPSDLVNIPPAEIVQPKATASVGANKTGQTASMQRVASLEHLQKCIREGAGSSGTQGAGKQ